VGLTRDEKFSSVPRRGWEAATMSQAQRQWEFGIGTTVDSANLYRGEDFRGTERNDQNTTSG
jgi:hypothetical protein